MVAWIYHEKQDAALCGLHSINNLLQFSCYTAYQLAEIAHEMDALEKEVMLSEGADTPDALKFLAGDSSNVDASGNFSIQVLSEALSRSHGIRLVPISKKGEGAITTTGYEAESGFVCNKSDHWFTMRRINGKYWNLNSTLEAPERITTFALEANIHQYELDGYSVFVVRGGTLPEPPGDGPDSGGSPADWYNEDALLGRSKDTGRIAGIGGLSTTTTTQSPKKSKWEGAGAGHRLSADNGGAGGASVTDLTGMTEEEQMEHAINLSLTQEAPLATLELPEEPNAGPGVIRVQVKLPTGKRVRRFYASDPAQLLWSFTAHALCATSIEGFEIVGPEGKTLDIRNIIACNTSFEEARLGGASVMVRLK